MVNSIPSVELSKIFRNERGQQKKGGEKSPPYNFMKLYIIPALEETLRNQGYKQLVVGAKKKGYEAVVLNLQLRRNESFSELVEEGVKIIKDTHCVIFGFSIGALIAYCISTKLPIKKVILCSTSPALGKDVEHIIKTANQYFGKKTVTELRKTTYKKSLAKKSIFLCGEKESDYLVDRTKKLCKKNNGELVIIKNNIHQLTPAYISEILKRL